MIAGLQEPDLIWKEKLEDADTDNQPAVTNWIEGKQIQDKRKELSEAKDEKLETMDKVKGVVLSCGVCTAVAGLLYYFTDLFRNYRCKYQRKKQA